MFSFGKNKTEARITGEFYTNAIHVMEGASLLDDGEVVTDTVPQCGERHGLCRLQGLHQLCCSALERGFPHRVLGSWKKRRSAASPQRKN